MSITLNHVSGMPPAIRCEGSRKPADTNPPRPGRFSLRRVNPLRPPLQVVSIQEARALSLDGLRWELQVRGESPEGLWGGNRGGERVFFRFGYWSSITGLRQVPISPILNNSDLIPRADQLVAELAAAPGVLPFPGIDVWELWLLDVDEGRPLALLRTQTLVPDPGDDFSEERLIWRAGAEDWLSGHAAADQGLFQEVEALIRGLAGESPQLAWFGPQDIRPELPWRMEWPTTAERALMGSYLSRQASRLLTLSGIGDELRARLEQEARHQAMEVAALWRLYPKVLDPGFLNAARVEARIRSTSGFSAQEAKIS